MNNKIQTLWDNSQISDYLNCLKKYLLSNLFFTTENTLRWSLEYLKNDVWYSLIIHSHHWFKLFHLWPWTGPMNFVLQIISPLARNWTNELCTCYIWRHQLWLIYSNCGFKDCTKEQLYIRINSQCLNTRSRYYWEIWIKSACFIYKSVI